MAATCNGGWWSAIRCCGCWYAASSHSVRSFLLKVGVISWHFGSRSFRIAFAQLQECQEVDSSCKVTIYHTETHWHTRICINHIFTSFTYTQMHTCICTRIHMQAYIYIYIYKVLHEFLGNLNRLVILFICRVMPYCSSIHQVITCFPCLRYFVPF